MAGCLTGSYSISSKPQNLAYLFLQHPILYGTAEIAKSALTICPANYLGS